MILSRSLFVVWFMWSPVFCQPLLKDAVDKDFELLAEESQEAEIVNEATRFIRPSRSADYYDDDIHERRFHDHGHHRGHDADCNQHREDFDLPGRGHFSDFGDSRFDHPHHHHSHEFSPPRRNHHHSKEKHGPPSRSHLGSKDQSKVNEDDWRDLNGDGNDEAKQVRSKTRQRSEPLQPTSTARSNGAGVVVIVVVPPSSSSKPLPTLPTPTASPTPTPRNLVVTSSRKTDAPPSTTPSTAIASSTTATEEPTFDIDLRFGRD